MVRSTRKRKLKKHRSAGRGLVEESCRTNATSPSAQNDAFLLSPGFRLRTSPNPLHSQGRHPVWRTGQSFRVFQQSWAGAASAKEFRRAFRRLRAVFSRDSRVQGLTRKGKFQAACLRSLRSLRFQKTTQAPRAPGVRRPSPCPSSPQGTQRAQRFRGFTRGRGGGGESFLNFLKITERQGFAHPHAQAFRWNFGFWV